MWWIRRYAKLFIIVLVAPVLGAQDTCQLDQEIKNLIDNAFAGNKGGGQKVYVSALSFLDKDGGTIWGTETAELINQAVQDGMKTAARQDSKYVVNDSTRTLTDNDENVKKLVAIYYDPKITKNDKITKIIRDIMEPAQIDGLLSGLYIQHPDQRVALRPFVVSRANRSLATEQLDFKVGEFLCPDPQNNAKQVLCTGAHDLVRDTVVRLLKQL